MSVHAMAGAGGKGTNGASGVARSASLYQQLAERVSLNRCGDRSFHDLRAILREWFSETTDGRYMSNVLKPHAEVKNSGVEW